MPFIALLRCHLPLRSSSTNIIIKSRLSSLTTLRATTTVSQTPVHSANTVSETEVEPDTTPGFVNTRFHHSWCYSPPFAANPTCPKGLDLCRISVACCRRSILVSPSVSGFAVLVTVGSDGNKVQVVGEVDVGAAKLRKDESDCGQGGDSATTITSPKLKAITFTVPQHPHLKFHLNLMLNPPNGPKGKLEILYPLELELGKAEYYCNECFPRVFRSMTEVVEHCKRREHRIVVEVGAKVKDKGEQTPVEVDAKTKKTKKTKKRKKKEEEVNTDAAGASTTQEPMPYCKECPSKVFKTKKGVKEHCQAKGHTMMMGPLPVVVEKGSDNANTIDSDTSSLAVKGDDKKQTDAGTLGFAHCQECPKRLFTTMGAAMKHCTAKGHTFVLGARAPVSYCKECPQRDFTTTLDAKNHCESKGHTLLPGPRPTINHSGPAPILTHSDPAMPYCQQCPTREFPNLNSLEKHCRSAGHILQPGPRPVSSSHLAGYCKECETKYFRTLEGAESHCRAKGHTLLLILPSSTLKSAKGTEVLIFKPEVSSTDTKIIYPPNIDPIHYFFKQYPTFNYDPLTSYWAEFHRLCAHLKWLSKSKPSKSALNRFRLPVTLAFNRDFGTSENDLEGWRRLFRCANLGETPDEVEKCKTAIAKIHMNLIDLHETQRGVGRVTVYKFESQLREYTRLSGKVFPRSPKEQSEVLKWFLREIYGVYKGVDKREPYLVKDGKKD